MNAALQLPLLLAPPTGGAIELSGTPSYNGYSATGAVAVIVVASGSGSYAGYSASGSVARLVVASGSGSYAGYGASGSAALIVVASGSGTYGAYAASGTASLLVVASGTGTYGAYEAAGAVELVGATPIFTLDGSSLYGAYSALGEVLVPGAAPVAGGSKVHFHYTDAVRKPYRPRRRRRPDPVIADVVDLPSLPPLLAPELRVPDPLVLVGTVAARGRALYAGYVVRGTIRVDDDQMELDLIVQLLDEEYD